MSRKPKCKVCKKREPKTNSKGKRLDRCAHCELRYDSKGRSFIVYSEVWRYQASRRGLRNMKLVDLYFWVCDDRVGNAPVPYEQTIGKDTNHLGRIMAKKGYVLIEVSKPVYK